MDASASSPAPPDLAEHVLVSLPPSQIISMTQEYTQFLLKIGDFALENKQPRLKDFIRDLLLLVPSGEGMGRGGRGREVV